MWTAGVCAAVALSAAVGLLLGMVGGGGSILLVPVLVYVVGLAPKSAVAVSLPIVAATAAVGALMQYRAGNTDLKAALLFAVSGMLGATLGAGLTWLFPGPVLMLLFAALLITVGLRMLGSRAEAEPEPGGECKPLRCGGVGLAVGVLTGFLGVGGGFLIVPALQRFARTPMRMAVGTSLSVIAANSAAGCAAHLPEIGQHLPLVTTLTFSALAGLAVGTVLGKRMHAKGLKTAFAGLALGVAVYVAAMSAAPLAGLLARRG
jgi:uncharacterized protein